MGMNMKQVDDVSRVVIEAAGKKIIIEQPEVAIISIQGQTVYQVGGGTSREELAGVPTAQDDAKLVAAQAGVSVDIAANALRQSNGDLAQAIILLKQKRP